MVYRPAGYAKIGQEARVEGKAPSLGVNTYGKNFRTDVHQRRFRFFSVVGFVVVLGLTWEFSLTTLVFNLGNGGTAGAIWLVLVVCSCMFFVMLSMAELASMAPTSGGQYHCTLSLERQLFEL